MNDNILELVITLLPLAPEELLNVIFCNCSKGCGTNCRCRKIVVNYLWALPWSIVLEFKFYEKFG